MKKCLVWNRWIWYQKIFYRRYENAKGEWYDGWAADPAVHGSSSSRYSASWWTFYWPVYCWVSWEILSYLYLKWMCIWVTFWPEFFKKKTVTWKVVFLPYAKLVVEGKGHRMCKQLETSVCISFSWLAIEVVSYFKDYLPCAVSWVLICPD